MCVLQYECIIDDTVLLYYVPSIDDTVLLCFVNQPFEEDLLGLKFRISPDAFFQGRSGFIKGGECVGDSGKVVLIFTAPLIISVAQSKIDQPFTVLHTTLE